MLEVPNTRDRRTFLILAGAQVAAWSVSASAESIRSERMDKPRRVTSKERNVSGIEKPSFSEALAVGRALDLSMPDSRAVQDAYAQAQAESPPWLFNHVMRSCFYGAKLAQHRALTPDAELVAVAVLLHDLACSARRPDRRRDYGRTLVRLCLGTRESAPSVWDSIAPTPPVLLHNTKASTSRRERHRV